GPGPANAKAFRCVGFDCHIPRGAGRQSGQFEIQQPKGTWQQPGEIQVPTGPWQKPGDIQVPKGIQDLHETKDKCEERLSVVADALFDFDKSNLRTDAEETLQAAGPEIAKFGGQQLNRACPLQQPKRTFEFSVSSVFDP